MTTYCPADKLPYEDLVYLRENMECLHTYLSGCNRHAKKGRRRPLNVDDHHDHCNLIVYSYIQTDDWDDYSHIETVVCEWYYALKYVKEHANDYDARPFLK